MKEKKKMLMYLVVLGDVEAHYRQKLRLAVNASFAVSEKLLLVSVAVVYSITFSLLSEQLL